MSLSPPNNLDAAHQIVQSFSQTKKHTAYDMQGFGAEQAPKLSYYNIFIELNDPNKALLYNSVSDTFVLLEENDLKTYQKLLAGEYARITHAELSPWVSMGFVIPENYDEKKRLVDDYHNVRGNDRNLILTIAPTMSCNFGCNYCFQGLDKPVERMSQHAMDGICDFVASRLHKLTNLSVTWYGGEPLMNKNAIYDISDRLLAMCNEKGVTYGGMIVTNGYFLNGKTAKMLSDRHVTTAQVTIDGPEEQHDVRRPLLTGRGSYSVILENLKEALAESEINISIRVNVAIPNAKEIYQLIDDLHAEGFGDEPRFTMYFAPVESTTEACSSSASESMSKYDYAELELALMRYANEKGLVPIPKAPRFMGLCVASVDNGYVITPEGNLHRCWDTAHEPSKRVGTLFDQVEAIENNETNKLWKAWDPFDNPICSACKISPICSGFCSYKFLHTEDTSGEAANLPCPPWKFNTAEYLFMRAEKLGLVTADDWNGDQSTRVAKHSGERHSHESVRKAYQTAMKKLHPNLIAIGG